ncbi:MAG: hypothetical protein RMA76_09610 [Deltaproteobacteria bacterium]|jgi:hypothetical protein
MKRSRTPWGHALGGVVVTLALLAGPSARADLGLVGEGKKQELDATQFDAPQKERYTLFKAKCTKCHPMQRPISALTTGVTPVSGAAFDDAGIKKYVLKMMRKPNSGIEKSDARELVVFLRHARSMAQKETP